MTRARSRLGAGVVVPLLLCLTLSLWLRPYIGLRHDAKLYLGQALMRLDPGVLSNDPFFLFGSQDRYSFASSWVAALLNVGDLVTVQFVVVVVAQVALLAALWRLAAPLPQLGQRWLALIGFILLGRSYGGLDVFNVAEQFVTARTFAEPLGLWAVVAMVERRWPWACALALLSTLAHPLMALPVCALLWVQAVSTDRRWLLLLAAAPVVIMLGWFGWGPSAALFRTLDPLWFDVTRRISTHLYLTLWQPSEWACYWFDIWVLALSASRAPLALRSPLQGTAWLGSALWMVTLVGVDGLDNLLLAQLQLWRVQWLAHALALACLPLLVLQLWREGGAWRWAASAAVAMAVAAHVRLNTSLWLLAWLGLAVWVACRPSASWLSDASRRALCACSGLLALLAALVGAWNGAVHLGWTTLDDVRLPDAVQWLLAIPLVSFPLTALVLAVATRPRPVLRRLALVALSAALVGGAVQWDRRTDWTRLLEGSLSAQPHPWWSVIPRGASVLWYDDFAASWLLLRRPNYVSDAQGAGQIFDRRTAELVQRRHDQVAPLDLQKTICSMFASFTEQAEADCMPSEDVLQVVCQRSPELQYMVFRKKLEKGWVSTWEARNGKNNVFRTYNLYRCDAYRS